MAFDRFFVRHRTREWRDPIRNRESAHFELDNLVASRFVLDILVPVVGMQPYPLQELMLMVGAVCWQRPTHIFEWGTHHGTSARVFWETTRHFGPPAHILSIDLPEETPHVEHPGAARGRLVHGRDRVELAQGDGLTVAMARYLSLPPDTRALFFLDGDHAFESVARELGKIVREAPGAAILIHDTFLQSADSGYNVGPHEAVDHILENVGAPSYERIETSTGLPGLTFLAPRA